MFNHKIIHNYTEPCPHCGIPACGRDDMLWYEENNKRITIVFDGGHFDLELQAFFKQNKKKLDYNTVTIFMKEWNEARGWSDSDDLNGEKLDIADFQHTLKLIKTNYPLEWIPKEMINNMNSLAQEARDKNLDLKILRG